MHDPKWGWVQVRVIFLKQSFAATYIKELWAKGTAVLCGWGMCSQPKHVKKGPCHFSANPVSQYRQYCPKAMSRSIQEECSKTRHIPTLPSNVGSFKQAFNNNKKSQVLLWPCRSFGEITYLHQSSLEPGQGACPRNGTPSCRALLLTGP